MKIVLFNLLAWVCFLHGSASPAMADPMSVDIELPRQLVSENDNFFQTGCSSDLVEMGDLTPEEYHRGLRRKKRGARVNPKKKFRKRVRKTVRTGRRRFQRTTIDDLLEARSDEFSTFVELADISGLSEDYIDNRFANSNRRLLSEEGITVFAPPNDAFAAVDAVIGKYKDVDIWTDRFLSAVLLYHTNFTNSIFSSDFVDGLLVIENSNKFIDSSIRIGVTEPPQLTGISLNLFYGSTIQITETDIVAGNGVLHIVDKVIIPAFVLSDAVTSATSTGQFKFFLELVDAAGVLGQVTGPGPFTFFPVPDLVFEAAGASVGADGRAFVDLLKAEPDLDKIILNHVISGQIFCGCEDASDQSLAGNTLSITEAGGSNFKVNGIDTVPGFVRLAVSNALVHAIQGILFPPGLPLFLNVV